MLLADFEGEALDFNVELDDRDRLTFAVLREVSALVSPAPTSEASGNSPASTPKGDEPVTLESAASLSFDAYTLDEPVLTPTAWGQRLNDQIWGLVLTDRLLRMGKAEMETFIRDAGERNADGPEAMYRVLDETRERLESWSKLLDAARCRYMVAASSAVLNDSAAARG